MIICLYIFHYRGFQGDDLITTCEDSTSDRENATIVKILFDIDLLQHCILFCVYDTVLSVLLLAIFSQNDYMALPFGILL